jgi:hypothetical protein
MNEARTTRDSRILAAGGTLFLGLAAFFLWRDLDLPRELVLLAGTVIAGLAAVLNLPRRWPAAAPAALLASSAIGGVWFLAAKSAGLLPALVAALVASALTVMRAEALPAPSRPPLAHQLRWYGLGASLVAATSALYFHFLTTGVAADSVARRLIPTVIWLAIGLALYIAGRMRTVAAAQVGLGLIGLALGKAIAYDTTHLAGGLRVLVLAAIGALLVFAALVTRRSPRGEV